jgi:hypothetical protein
VRRRRAGNKNYAVGFMIAGNASQGS